MPKRIFGVARRVNAGAMKRFAVPFGGGRFRVMTPPKVGTVSWFDLTIRNADKVRDFYRAVAGGSVMPVEMDGYSDYCGLMPLKRGVRMKIPSPQ